MHPSKRPIRASAGEPFDSRLLVDAIARELWGLYAEHGTLNWGDVERHLGEMVEQTRADGQVSFAMPAIVRLPTCAQSRGSECLHQLN